MKIQHHPSKSQENEIGLSTKTLRLVLRKTKIYSLFEQSVNEPRHRPCTYSLASLLMSGVFVHLLRLPSRHAFYDEAKTSTLFAHNLAKAIEAPSLPSAKTLEDCLLQINPQDLNSLLPNLFKQLLRSKFFTLHPEYKTGDHFSLAIDAFTSHIYHPHNQHPVECCPYCLKRQRGKAIWYSHIEVVLSIVGPRFRFPLFLYRVKGRPNWGLLSENKLKQECELTALPYLIEQFRSHFPKLPFTLLADSLYASITIMQLSATHRFDYLIVRKEGSLKHLNDVKSLKTLLKPQKRLFDKGRWQVAQTAYLLEGFSHRGHPFQVIDLQEQCTKLTSKRFAKVNEKSSHWQWMLNGTFFKAHLFKKADEARYRWYQEDLFNTFKNRGFFVKHDMSRSPHSQTIWKHLMLIAYALSLLMDLSRIGAFARKGMSLCNWMRDLWAEFAKVHPDLLWRAPLPKQLRFLFDTS